MTEYRMLAAGERIREGDQLRYLHSTDTWIDCIDSIGDVLHPVNVGRWRRPLRDIEPASIIHSVRYQHEQIAETFRLIVAAGYEHD